MGTNGAHQGEIAGLAGDPFAAFAIAEANHLAYLLAKIPALIAQGRETPSIGAGNILADALDGLTLLGAGFTGHVAPPGPERAKRRGAVARLSGRRGEPEQQKREEGLHHAKMGTFWPRTRAKSPKALFPRHLRPALPGLAQNNPGTSRCAVVGANGVMS